MEINSNTNMDSIGRTNGFRPRGKNIPSVKEPVSLKSTQALNQTMSKLPEVRTAEVQRAQRLIRGSVPYPPAETITKISQLLALKLDRN